MNKVLAIATKELWELRRSGIKYAALFLGSYALLIALLVVRGGAGDDGMLDGIPAQFFLPVLLIANPLALISQIVSTSYHREKKTATLEVLLSMKLTGRQILNGKLLPGVLFGVIAYLVFAGLSLIVGALGLLPLGDGFGRPIEYAVLPLLAMYFVGVSSIVVAMLVSDENVMRFLVMFVVLGITALLIVSLFNPTVRFAALASLPIGSVVISLLCDRRLAARGLLLGSQA